jgi:hypothetical protein
MSNRVDPPLFSVLFICCILVHKDTTDGRVAAVLEPNNLLAVH